MAVGHFLAGSLDVAALFWKVRKLSCIEERQIKPAGLRVDSGP